MIFSFVYFPVVDGVPPDITCPDNIVRTISDGNAGGGVVNWSPATASDNSPVAPTVTLSSGQNPPVFLVFGVSSYTYTATDATGNTAQCTFTVTVGESHLSHVVFKVNCIHPTSDSQ